MSFRDKLKKSLEGTVKAIKVADNAMMKAAKTIDPHGNLVRNTEFNKSFDKLLGPLPGGEKKPREGRVNNQNKATKTGPESDNETVEVNVTVKIPKKDLKE